MVRKSLLFLMVLLLGSFSLLKAQDVVYDFETGDIPSAFTNTSSYPWIIVADGDNNYIQSGNAGVASSTSTISATHVFESDGYIAFDYNCMGEGSSTFWDHCDFAIDGTQIFTHGADHQGWDSFLQELAAGSHTFTWSYTKDSSVNPTGDYFAVDNIVFGEGSPCVAPSTLSVSGRTFIATWNGIADVYTFRYKAAAETTWTTISNITANTCTLPELAFGDYNAEVQADCDAGNWTATTFTVSDPSDYNVCVILEAHDVWGDGSGYQMLLDADASAYGDIIPETGGLTSSGNAPAGLYDNFEFLIPEDADGNLTTTHIVFDGEVAIYIPAGVYDWCIVNPTPGDRLWIASSNGDCPGRYDDFEFLANNTYRFTLGVYGTNDGVSLTVTQNGPVIQTAAVTGFTAPRFGEAPDFDLVAPTHTTITDVKWYKGTAEMAATDTFDDESASYHMSVVLEAEEGYEFDPQVTVTFNGDATICASATLTDGVLTANTINYNVVDSDVYDFEDGTFQGWTTIDADGDGITWLQASEYMSGQAGHDNSLDFVFSQSYDNNTGVLYPDNYLVSPAKAHYTQISFFACAQDSGYPSEHFGVAVSTGSNTSAADFVMVQEWTMTSKKAAGEYRTREGSRDQGNWYEYTVDLSGFTGEYWVAIRHFNCSDMFYLDVDDISLAIGDAVVENYADVMTIYPNPAKDRVFVTSDVTVNEYRVYNVTGTEIMNNVVNNTTFEVNVDNLPAGVYYIRIYSEGLIQTKKFVKE